MAFDETTVGHGKNLVFSFGTLSSETDISQYIKDVTFTGDVDEAEAAGTGSTKHYKAGQSSATCTVTGTVTSGASDAYLILAAALGTEAKSLIYGPMGSTQNQPKVTARGFVKSIAPKASPSGVVEFTATIRLTGTVTYGTWA